LNGFFRSDTLVHPSDHDLKASGRQLNRLVEPRGAMITLNDYE
jgi:hypothetical protein